MPRHFERRKKRKYHGNRYTVKQARAEEVHHTSTQENLSRSSKKVSTEPAEKAPRNSNGFRIIDFDLLSGAIRSIASCKNCQSKDSLTLIENTERGTGVVTELSILCEVCQSEVTFLSSKKIGQQFEANARLVYGMRCIGRGYQASRVFCAIMDIPSPPTRFTNYYGTLENALNEETEASMKNAVIEAVEENNGDTDIAVSLDGTWHKRGHQSLHGVVSCISIDTGKVIDYSIKSKYCQGCISLQNCNDATKLNDHKKVCVKSYEGSSGGMEVEGVKDMFLRSDASKGVRYVHYLGDGDTKSYKSVVDLAPYGSDVEISKLECVGHVQKRMGGRLKKIVNTNKGVKLEDGKGIGGRGRLTEKEIANFQAYYGKAIRENLDSLSNMRKAVWATFFHKISTDDHPSHALCPKGDNSWCKYNKNMKSGKSYSHKSSLPVVVMEKIKPIFRDLSHPDLLKRCLHGKTQNANESFNSVVWNRCPKDVFVGNQTLKIGVLDAIICFNDGMSSRLKVLSNLGIASSQNAQAELLQIDKIRVFKAELSLGKKGKGQKRVTESSETDESYGYGQH